MAPNNKYNIILISVDCLRADHLGCLQYKKNTTPHLDLIANNGVNFTQASSNATHTTASVPSFLTGTYPLYNGNVLLKDRTTIAEILKKNGYKTTAFHSNAIISKSPKDYKNGFDIFEDLHETAHTDHTTPLQKVFSFIESSNGIEIIKKIERVFGIKTFTFRQFIGKIYFSVRKKTNNPYAPAPKITENAISYMEKLSSSSNFFLWLHYMDAHSPFYPPKTFFRDISDKKYDLNKGIITTIKASGNYQSLSDKEKNAMIDLYDSSIKYVDYAINDLYHYLKDSGLSKNTYVILTADHGEEFWDHGHFGHGGGLSNVQGNQLTGRPIKIYEELTHVPLIILGPNIKPNIINQPVSLIDIAPTIMDLLDLNQSKTFDGNSLISFIKNTITRDNISYPVIAEAIDPWDPFVYPNHPMRSEIISYKIDQWKYIHYTKGKINDELYNIVEDPHENNNIIELHPKIANMLITKILVHMGMKQKSAGKSTLKNKIGQLRDVGKI